jgi:hypothetical protein
MVAVAAATEAFHLTVCAGATLCSQWVVAEVGSRSVEGEKEAVEVAAGIEGETAATVEVVADSKALAAIGL